MSRAHTSQLIAAIGTTAVVLLVLNGVAATSAPMLRFVVAIGVAAGVVALLRNVTDSHVG